MDVLLNFIANLIMINGRYCGYWYRNIVIGGSRSIVIELDRDQEYSTKEAVGNVFRSW